MNERNVNTIRSLVAAEECLARAAITCPSADFNRIKALYDSVRAERVAAQRADIDAAGRAMLEVGK